MKQVEHCPFCSNKIDITSILSRKMPLIDILNPFQWFKYFHKIKNYDLIICPFCNKQYRTKKAKFFKFISPRYLLLLLGLYISFFLIATIIELLRNYGIID